MSLIVVGRPLNLLRKEGKWREGEKGADMRHVRHAASAAGVGGEEGKRSGYGKWEGIVWKGGLPHLRKVFSLHKKYLPYKGAMSPLSGIGLGQVCFP